MKGVILCAGRGTRLHPFSYSQPKTLLPVANHPVLYYCIRKLREVGIHEIGIVIHPSQLQIPAYVGDGSQFEATIRFIPQETPLGIAHAVQLAQSFVNGEPFVLLLGDNLLMDSLHDLIHTFEQTHADGVVMLSKVERPQDYGIAEVREGHIVSVTEKPTHPKSDLAVIGAYLFTPSLFDSVANLQPSARGEYEITDAIQLMIEGGRQIAHTVTNGKYSDVGTIERWLEANQWVLSREIGDRYVVGENSVVTNCDITGPVLIGADCRIENCRIGPYVSIQNGARIKNCTHIEHSILLEDSALSDIHWPISRSVFGRSAHLIGMQESEKGMIILSDKSTIQIPRDHKKDES